MANTVNGGSHSSIESLNGEFCGNTRRVLERNYHCVKIVSATFIWRLFVIYSLYTLSGSWVKLDGSFRNGNGAQHSPVISEDDAMEDLLAEAVEEQSKQGSR